MNKFTCREQAHFGMRFIWHQFLQSFGCIRKYLEKFKSQLPKKSGNRVGDPSYLIIIILATFVRIFAT